MAKIYDFRTRKLLMETPKSPLDHGFHSSPYFARPEHITPALPTPAAEIEMRIMDIKRRLLRINELMAEIRGNRDPR